MPRGRGRPDPGLRVPPSLDAIVPPVRRATRSSGPAAGHVRRPDPGRQRGHPRDPRRGPRRPAPGRPVGRGRDRTGDDLVGRARLLRAQGRAQPAPVRVVPRRPPPLGVRGAGRAAGRGPRTGRPVRAAGCAPALRRVDPAGRAGRPDPAVRGAQGATRGRGPVRRRAQAAAARPTGDDRGHHQPDRRGLEGHLHGPRAALAADPGRARRRPGPGRRRAGQPRRRVPQGRAVRGGASGGRPARRSARPSRSWPAAAARSRTCGRSTTRSSSGPSWPMPCPSCAGSVTRPTSRWPTSRPTSGRPPRRPPPRSSSRTGPSSSSRFATPGAGSTGPRPRACGRRRARSSPSDGRSTGSARRRSSRAHANGSACCSIGRPGRSARSLPRAGVWRTASAGAWPRRCPAGSDAIAGASSAWACSIRWPCAGRRPPAHRSARPAAALAVLAPQATLDRGYAIVHRAGDGAIVRDPAEAPAGTRLALRVARGELPATADER